jgi:hypothetical protein
MVEHDKSECLKHQKNEASAEVGPIEDSEVTNVEQLKEVDCKEHEGKHLLLDDTPALELSVIGKGKVVLFYPVLDGEEGCDEDADKGVSA